MLAAFERVDMPYPINPIVLATSILLVALFSLGYSYPEQVPKEVIAEGDTLVTYVWVGDPDEGAAIAADQMPFESFEIDVPPGFDERHEWYGEGLLTGLRYPDGSALTLHMGGLVTFPITESVGARERPSPTDQGRVLCGEVSARAWSAYLGVYHPLTNVLFDLVPLERRATFKSALDSVRLIEKETD